jgi:hypothetical protein
MAIDELEPTVTANNPKPSQDLRELLASVETPQRMTWPQVSRAITEVAALADNWDGQGADAPTVDTVELARFFVSLIRQAQWPAPSNVRATPDGCISFEWNNHSELILEAEVSQGGIEYITSGPGLPTRSRFERVT